ncbi:hypothetical protein NEF87_004796 [Candidatus Lokiarchaeum ossiferum]|uniref:Uncharacterized protein n=1 Tax=Candidatus Lokiarchaeum ossiferum TaxID=2951803 RepID=A0ABY6I115_9ARCH|nr:hypothetical protein NEF87_004796 [Candidatus Lokiarchaeum sp. B-35]
MISTELNIGDCPYCGDEMFVFRTQSRSRMAKCINECCPAQFGYGIPKKGNLEITALFCPKPIPSRKGLEPQPHSHIQLLAVIPKQYIKTGTFRSQSKKTYFWTMGPCFTCSQRSTCEALAEAKEEFLE